MILLTSYKDFSFVQQGIALGIAGYMIKNEITKEQVDSEIKGLFSNQKWRRRKTGRILKKLTQFFKPWGKEYCHIYRAGGLCNQLCGNIHFSEDTYPSLRNGRERIQTG